MQKRLLCVAMPVLFMLAGGISQSAAAQPTGAGPGAFLASKADGAQALVKQVMTNRTVAMRYARHYGTSPEFIARYFQQNLKLRKLTSPLRATTYYVSSTSMTFSKSKLIPAGALVYTSADGKPLLEYRCGNPLTKSLPVVQTKVVQPVPKPVIQVKSNVETTVPQLPLPVVPVQAVQTVETITTAPVLMPFMAEIEPVIDVTAPLPVAASPSIPMIGYIAPLLLGAVSVHSPPPSPEVPEPTSIVALGLSVPALFLGTLRKKRFRP